MACNFGCFENFMTTWSFLCEIWNLYKKGLCELVFALYFQANPGIVTCLENHPHKLETGQFLTFREINGMTGLNGSTQQITGKFMFINLFILIHYSVHLQFRTLLFENTPSTQKG